MTDHTTDRGPGAAEATPGPIQSNPASSGSDPVVSSPGDGDAIDDLRRIIRRGQRRWKALILVEGLALAVAVPLAYLWLAFVLDNLLHLDTVGRVAAFAVFAVIAVWIIWHLLKSWRRANFTEDQVALAIEQRTPGGLQNRLINALQLARVSDAERASLNRAVVQENHEFLKRVELRQSAASRPALLRVGLALVVIGLGLAFYRFEQQRFTTAATRIFLPLSNTAPWYDTRLSVLPGDQEVASGQDVTVEVRIQGQRPRQVALLVSRGQEQQTQTLPVPDDARTVTFQIPEVQKSLIYAVRGGDFTSPYYRLVVPMPLQLAGVKAELNFPAYTGLEPVVRERTRGDVEAPRGTEATLRFAFNQPVQAAWIQFDDGGKVELEPAGSAAFRTEYRFDATRGYHLQARLADGKPVQSWRYTLAAEADRVPDMALGGLEDTSEAMFDEVVPVQVRASDDYGLDAVQLVYRRITETEVDVDIDLSAGFDGDPGDGSDLAWQTLQTWRLDDTPKRLKVDHALTVSMLGAAEGERVELAVRGRDTAPERAGSWVLGPREELTVSSEGAELQLLYEQLLRSQEALAGLVRGHEKQIEQAERWIRQLEPFSDVDWAQPENQDQLAAAMRTQAKAQAGLREQATRAARRMIDDAGTIKVALGMLADTEMVRSIRILESVPSRETPQAKRSTLSDARLTQQRTLRSLSELDDRYGQFRQQWELAHMMPFVQMLAERQVRLSEAAATYAGLSPGAVGEAQRTGLQRRQAKLGELADLAQRAFDGMAQRSDRVGDIMAEAFADAATRLGSETLTSRFTTAGSRIESGAWAEAEAEQRLIADTLHAIHRDLKLAKTQAARMALDRLNDAVDSGLLAEDVAVELVTGSKDNPLQYDAEKLELEELVQLEESLDWVENKKTFANQGLEKNYDHSFEKQMLDMMSEHRPAPEQDLSILSLADKPGGEQSFPNMSDLPPNEVQAAQKDTLKDLVGDLLEESEVLREDFETLSLNAAFGPKDPGDVAKVGGDLNSTGAMATTGNQKPPSHNVGGMSGSGRQGARAYGMTASQTSVNRRGRDQVQEGQTDAPDQEGELREVMSDDPQHDASTGSGGKQVDTDRTQNFSTISRGQFDAETAEKMKAPKDEAAIVERKARKLSAAVAERMRDLESRQRQVIKRVKRIKKELDALFLPSDHLDELMSRMQANLDRLKDRPDAEGFRRQAEMLDKLRGTVIVFNRPSREFAPSLQREQKVEGRILDEPAWPTLPGYEDAVSEYYQRLAGPQ